MLVDEGLGMRLSGVGMIALAIWLLRFDIATMTIRREGLPRFVAACLLAGYAWLGIAGAIVLLSEPTFAGFSYDAYLHAVLLGFVFSMVFGHAPIIFPAIVERPIGFNAFAYVPLVVLHFSVALRILADLAGNQMVRQAAGVWTGVAIVLYGAFIVYGLIRGDSRTRRSD